MPDPIARTYLSLGAFYASDPARRSSRERDVGLFWRSRSGPSFRAAWVRDTGELYLFQHALGGRGGGSVHLLAPPLDEAELERRLAGWQDVCGREGSLEWLLARVQDLPPDGAPVPPARRFRRGRGAAARHRGPPPGSPAGGAGALAAARHCANAAGMRSKSGGISSRGSSASPVQRKCTRVSPPFGQHSRSPSS